MITHPYTELADSIGAEVLPATASYDAGEPVWYWIVHEGVAYARTSESGVSETLAMLANGTLDVPAADALNWIFNDEAHDPDTQWLEERPAFRLDEGSWALPGARGQ